MGAGSATAGRLGQGGLERPAHIGPVECGEVIEAGQVLRLGFGSSHDSSDDRPRRYSSARATGTVGLRPARLQAAVFRRTQDVQELYWATPAMSWRYLYLWDLPGAALTGRTRPVLVRGARFRCPPRKGGLATCRAAVI